MDMESAKESEQHRAQAPPLANTHHTAALWPPRGWKIHKVPELLRQEERSKVVSFGPYHHDKQELQLSDKIMKPFSVQMFVEGSIQSAYDPKVVSFGPYHHDKPELQLCEKLKPFAVQMFVEGSSRSTQFFHAKVLEVIADARSCYFEGSTDKYNDDQFAEMMLLDACFLIYYMNVGTQNPKHRGTMYCELGLLVYTLINRDILLLENQIPFPIVMLLINLRYEKGEEAVRMFLHQSIWGQYKRPKIQDSRQQQNLNQYLHLLEAFRRVLVWDWTPQTQARAEQQEKFDLKEYHKNFRSAKDLKAKGIHLKPSSNKSLKDINFRSFTFYGQLELPTWFVTSLSKAFFMNMIAYELCPSNYVPRTVISYVNFMKLLIESPADVKELREKRILFTSLGSDEEVMGLYRDLKTYGTASAYSFLEVKQKVQEHYDSKSKTRMAQLISIYFSSPWSIIAWFAGLLLLILTCVQTYFTVNPR